MTISCFQTRDNSSAKRDLALSHRSFWGHGNERADDLVRLGAGQPIVSPEPEVGISEAQIKEHFLLWEEENNKEVWIQARDRKSVV